MIKSNIVIGFVFFFIGIISFAQTEKKIQKAWIKTKIENLGNTNIEIDTLYLRYTFDKTILYMSFNPGWETYKQDWSINKELLKIGFSTYQIEELTDTSLIFSLQGFRRMKFLSEDYLRDQEKYLISLGNFNGKPLYKANDYISPRYSKKESLQDLIQKNLEGYNIKKATNFLASFIVNEKGVIENIIIIKSITEGFDREVISQLKKTSKNWNPAYHKGKPIQTLMYYSIKYLDSIAP